MNLLSCFMAARGTFLTKPWKLASPAAIAPSLRVGPSCPRRSALDAVEAAIMVLEDDAVFDAGYGSHLNFDGRANATPSS